MKEKKVNNGATRVLEIISKAHLGGIETMLMNVNREIDHNKLILDFTNFTNEEAEYEEEIKKYGGKIHYIKPLREIGPIKYVLQMKKLVKENNYKIVHSHLTIVNSLALFGAYLGGAKIRISHSHITSSEKPNTFKYNLAVKIMRKINLIFATKYCACGIEAGEFLYGKKMVKKNKVQVINNAVDLNKFKKYYNKKMELRKEYNFPTDKIIIGNIGRFTPVKNQEYILKMALRMRDKNILDKYLFILIGTGQDFSKHEKFIKDNKLDKNVLLYGTTNDIPQMFAMFDYFILPSLYEGLPVVSVEAQAAGVHSIFSNQVTEELDFGLGLVEFLGISDDDLDKWIDKITKIPPKKINYDIIDKVMTEKGYSVKSSVQTFYNLYNIEK